MTYMTLLIAASISVLFEVYYKAKLCNESIRILTVSFQF